MAFWQSDWAPSQACLEALAYLERMEVEPTSEAIASWACRQFTDPEMTDTDDYSLTKYLNRMIRALVEIERAKL